MVCSNCKEPLVKLRNWSFYDTGVYGVDCGLNLYAKLQKNRIFHGERHDKRIVCRPMICTSCGKVEIYLNEKQIEEVLNVEKDDRYSS